MAHPATHAKLSSSVAKTASPVATPYADPLANTTSGTQTCAHGARVFVRRAWPVRVRERSAALGAQLTQPAPIVRLQPFLRESSLVVVPKDVHELEHHPVAIRRKGPDRRARELAHESSRDRRLARYVVALDDHDPAADGQVGQRCSQRCEV